MQPRPDLPPPNWAAMLWLLVAVLVVVLLIAGALAQLG